MADNIQELATYITDCCEDLSHEDLSMLIDHTTGPLRAYFEDKLNERIEADSVADWEDFGDLYAFDHTTGDYTRQPDHYEED